MQATFQRGSFITRRIHPLAVRFQTGESGIDQAIRQSQRIAFDGEIAINTPIFCPHSQHSSQRSCKSGQPRKLIVFAEANGDVGVGDEACVLRRRVVVQVLNVRQPRRMVAHEQRGVHLTALRFNFCSVQRGAETTLKLFHCWPPSDSAGVRNVTR